MSKVLEISHVLISGVVLFIIVFILIDFPDKVVALYPYTAANPDELTFAKDDIISVTAREEEAWWRGELNGVSGLFPSNYVAPLRQQCE